ncbi:MFS transporter [Micromonospora sp. NBC_01813]|uniref:MFS transporter n=1 Tax=Micromonospora sp. NBC_01813 TaxID=2975988 RepID=UPI002DDA0809|nr:MFS transporter [Micromonospora sp. NBC_01813]WSA10206.1 MFS transporter [Micromonospora sp. NBC_01813]
MTGMLRGFGMLWFGQTISFVGSALTGFVLGVWVYQSTGSATQFAIISLAAVLPGIVFAPFAGVLADRRDRRTTMLVADLAAGLVTAGVATLLWTDHLTVWHIYLATALTAVFNTAHITAFYAMMPLLVPREGLGRANGLMQMTQAGQIAAPLLAGALVGTIGLRGVILIDLCTMAVGVALLIAARLDRAATAAPAAGKQITLRQDLGYGWQLLRGKPGLFQLAVLFGGFNFLFALAGVLVQPLILSFGSAATLGVLMFAGGAGLFVGSLVMSAWGGPKRRVRGIIGFLAWGAVALFLHGMYPSAWLIAVVAPLFLFTLPILNGSVMTVIQTKVPTESLGRVVATTRMIGQSATPVAYLVAGPLADRIAEPALAPGGALAGSVGTVIGTGPGRGIAALFWLIGAAMLLVAAVAAARPRLRRLEVELADADAAADADADSEPAGGGVEEDLPEKDLPEKDLPEKGSSHHATQPA